MKNLKAIEYFVFWLSGHAVFIILFFKLMDMGINGLLAAIISLAFTSPIVVGTAWILKAIEYSKENSCSIKEGFKATEDFEWLD